MREGGEMDAALLGPFELHSGGRPVDLGDLQQRYTLAALLLRANRPISAERLTEIVWAGQQAPRSNLVPHYIAKVRKAFRDAGATDDDASIERTPTGYVLHIDPDRIDIVRFGRLCDQASAAAADGDTARQLALLREAVGLWRGRYLEDLDIDRVGAAEVTSPEERYLDILGDLAELELVRHGHRWVRDRLRPVVRQEPIRQRLAGLLMRALVANGDRVQAVEVYHRTREALDEFGMETSVDLRRFAAFAQRALPESTVPAAPERFTGRDDELKTILTRAQAAIDEDRPSVVWISGMPGVGKTALALQVAHLLRSHYPDGQFHLALNGFTPNVAPMDPGEALGTLLGHLGVPPEQQPGSTDRRARLYQHSLLHTRTMVVLDSAASLDQVRALLPTAPGCLAVVTSRRTGGIEAGDPVYLDPLPPPVAAELFGNLVGDARVLAEARAVEDVVERCGYLPLQIRVVASQLRRHRGWPVEHLVRLLAEAGLWRAEGGFDDAGMVACAVSYGQLDEQQRLLFRLFGRIPGPDLSVRGAAAALACSVRRAGTLLAELHDASLLEEVAPERYLMLDPLREFAGGISTPGEDDAVAVDRLLDFYLVTVAAATRVVFAFDSDRQPVVARVSAAAPDLPDSAAGLAWLSAERLNLLDTVRYAAAHGRPEHTWQLAVLLWRWHYGRGQLLDWLEMSELAWQVSQDSGVDRDTQADVLLRLSGARRQAGRPVEAAEFATRVLAIRTELADQRGQAAALCVIALATMDRGDTTGAIGHFEAALALYEQAGDERGTANALSNLGQLNEAQGDLALAERRLTAAADLLTRLGHLPGLANTLDNRGIARQRLGALTEALADHERARDLAVEAADRSCEAYALNNIANVHRRAGRLAKALAQHDIALEVADTLGDPQLRTQLSLDRGATHLARGEHEQARQGYLGALDLAAGIGDRGQQAHADHGVALALHADGRHADAVGHWRAAETAFAELGRPEADQVRRERADLACACGTRP
jgi:DNA-binding SARP family transcriptional activator/tetratricopeptide (TPR) repeat protein